jgi:hypothetical protein
MFLLACSCLKSIKTKENRGTIFGSLLLERTNSIEKMIRFHFVLGSAGQQWPTKQHSDCHSVDATPCSDQRAPTAVVVKGSSFLVTLVGGIFGTVILGFLLIPVLYYCLIVAIPLHWIYDPLPHAGPMSVYLPGMLASALVETACWWVLLAPSVPYRLWS